MDRSAPIAGDVMSTLEHQAAAVDVEDALLASLRRRLGRPGLRYAEKPEPILGGTESWILGFRLAGAPAGWDVPLVLRLARDGPRPLDLGFEAAVQKAVAGQGFPAPRVLAVGEGDDELGRPHLVMARIPGEAGPEGLLGSGRQGRAALLLGLRTLLRDLPRVQARALLELHALDPAPLERSLDPARRPTLDARLDLLEAESAATSWAPLRELVDWLRLKRPPDPPRVSICHGDFHVFNLIFEGPRIRGVVDWTGASLADPHLDLGVVRAQLRISQLPVDGLPGRLVHGCQMRILRAFERAYGRGRPLDPERLAYFEVLPCAASVVRMFAEGSDPDREPLAQLAWEHPRALGRLERRVREVTGIRLGVAPG